MEKDLISKKELLEITGISYGQLYRWKRKNLIPEEWFIRKSAFTGQETFFPRQKTLARINKIVNMKDGLPLDDMADLFSPAAMETAPTPGELTRRNIVSTSTMEFFLEQQENNQEFTFASALFVFILEDLFRSGELGREEGKSLLQVLRDNHDRFDQNQCELLFLRKLGISICCLATAPAQLYFDSATKVVARIKIASFVEELKIRLNQEGE
jgi:DNA-binding transcriptional MerR regulator